MGRTRCEWPEGRPQRASRASGMRARRRHAELMRITGLRNTIETRVVAAKAASQCDPMHATGLSCGLERGLAWIGVLAVVAGLVACAQQPSKAGLERIQHIVV